MAWAARRSGATSAGIRGSRSSSMTSNRPGRPGLSRFAGPLHDSRPAARRSAAEFDEAFIRVTPERVISYGLGAAGHDLRSFDARDVSRSSATSPAAHRRARDRAGPRAAAARGRPVPPDVGRRGARRPAGRHRDHRPARCAGRSLQRDAPAADRRGLVLPGGRPDRAAAARARNGRVASRRSGRTCSAATSCRSSSGPGPGWVPGPRPAAKWSLFATSMAPGFVPADYDPGDRRRPQPGGPSTRR